MKKTCLNFRIHNLLAGRDLMDPTGQPLFFMLEGKLRPKEFA